MTFVGEALRLIKDVLKLTDEMQLATLPRSSPPTV